MVIIPQPLSGAGTLLPRRRCTASDIVLKLTDQEAVATQSTSCPGVVGDMADESSLVLLHRQLEDDLATGAVDHLGQGAQLVVAPAPPVV
eukprot:1836227-Prymnesium_polylepis.1